MRVASTVWMQAIDGIRTHRGRSLATVIAIIIATALAIAIPGLARSSQAGVAAVFAATNGKDVTWRGQPANTITPTDVDRLASLPGVEGVGASFATTLIATTPWAGTDNVGVLAIHGDLPAATRMSFAEGDLWTPDAAANSTPVAIIGQGVAAQLGVAGPGALILINGLSYTVTGIFVEGTPTGLSGSVLIPMPTAMTDFPLATLGLATATVATAPHNLEHLALVGTTVLAPTDPSMVRADYSSGSQELAILVSANLDLGSYALTAVSAVIAAAMTAIFLNAAVRARRAEIGLRKALGASTGHIVTQFLLEGILLGCWGAGMGVLVGVLLVRGVSIANGWPTVLAGNIVELAFAQTLTATIIAALIPAWLAGRVDPIDALTSPAQ